MTRYQSGYQLRYREKNSDITAKTPISDPISGPTSQLFWAKTVSCHSRYRSFCPDIGVFPPISQPIFRITRFLPLAISGTSRISQRTSGPIWHAISGYTDITAKKLRCRPRHQNIRTSALLQMSGLICYLPRRRPPPAALATAGPGPGAPIAPASWSSARLEGLYTVATLLIPLKAIPFSY